MCVRGRFWDLRSLACLAVLAVAGCENPSPCAEGTYSEGPPRACVLDDGTVVVLDDAAIETPDAAPDAFHFPDATLPDGCVTRTVYRDDDGDGRGDPSTGEERCGVLAGWSEDNTDCDDSCDTCWSGAAETCDSIDQDCDGSVDEGALSTWHRDADGDTYGSIVDVVEACEAPDGYIARGEDCDDECTTCTPEGTEVCDGARDENCDGVVDEMCACTTGTSRTCLGGTETGPCARGMQTCTGGTWDACVGRVDPIAESCNGADDDCDGSADEGVQTTYYRDMDTDTYGVATTTRLACSAPSGYVARAGDCDDTRMSVFPGAPEVCNGISDDCDAPIDEGLATQTYHADCDGDTYRAAGAQTRVGCAAPTSGPLTCPSGTWTTRVSPTDCDDTRSSVRPGGTEVCNTLNDDCDGATDEGVTTTYYRDADGDTYGVSGMTMLACSQPPGYVTRAGDCNDGCMTCHPGNTVETMCDGLNDDCDGSIDEGVLTTYYVDCDRDSYAPTSSGSQVACSVPSGPPASCSGGSWTSRVPMFGSTDCADADARAYPTQTAYQSTPITGAHTGPDYDFNCDNSTTYQTTPNGSYTACTLGSGCTGSGIVGPGGPGDSVACGETGTYLNCFIGITTCAELYVSGPQRCR